MKKHEYEEARDAMFAILQRQPNVFKETLPTEITGRNLAIAAWAFIDEFNRQYKEKVTEGAIKM